MANVLEIFKNEELIDFSAGLGSLNVGTMGDRLFPDRKTKNLKASYLQIAGKQIPSMALVHGFDTEAKIGKRQTLEKFSVEKFLVKEKINLSELEREYKENGVFESEELKQYIFNDFGRLAQSVKTRVEVAKMELLWNGKITVKENGLNYVIGDGLFHGKKTGNWVSPDADILGDIKEWIKLGKQQGYTINRAVTSDDVVMLMCKNKAIQTLIHSSLGVGVYTDLAAVNGLLSRLFNGFTVEVNDDIYQYDSGKGGDLTERYIPNNKFAMYAARPDGTAGACLWGTTPEERVQGIWTAKSSQQFITLSGWATQDPVVEWFKASGLAVPVMPNAKGQVVADITLA